MSLSPIPTDTRIAVPRNPLERVPPLVLSSPYQAWFSSIWQWLSPIGQTGTTTARPTKNLYVGLGYFDTTLGYMVWVKQVSPSIVWVNYNGTVV